MAIIVTKNLSALRIRFDCGTDDNGDNLTKVRTYNGVKDSASNEDILAVVNSLVGLQSNTMEIVTKVDNTTLSE